MNRCRMLTLLALLITISSRFAANAQMVTEPIVDGKPISLWLADYQKSFSTPEHDDDDPQMRARAEVAVLKVGTNAIPWLLQELSVKEAARAGELPTNFTSGTAIVRRWLAVTAFEILGPVTKDVTPKLLPLLNDRQTSYTAAIALGGTGTNSIPALTQALTNSHATARESAVGVLGMFGAKAKAAVPAVVECTKDADVSVREFAAFALKQIDPVAATKEGIE